MKYGDVITSDNGTGSLRFMLIAPHPEAYSRMRGMWDVLVLRDHSPGMYGEVGKIIVITHVTTESSAWAQVTE